MRVLVTGSSGFVGAAVTTAFLRRGDEVTGVSRGAPAAIPAGLRALSADITAGSAVVDTALRSCDVVVHAAARVHVMRDTAADPLAEFRRANTEATAALAKRAVELGVRRFVFISSIKVLGEHSLPAAPLRSSMEPRPVDPYGISKREAEDALRAIAQSTGLEVVIIRPVLVYGPGVKGNFRSMLRWLARGIPLPLAGVRNRRSLVARDNLVDLLVTAAIHPAAPGATLLVSDGEDLSTPELLRRAASAMRRPARLVPVPPALLEMAGAAMGKRAAVQRLIGSLQVDISPTRDLLGWSPPVKVDDALQDTVNHFLREDGRR